MMDEWERTSPGRTEQVFKSLQKVQPSQLADPALFDFAALGTRGSSTSANWLLPDAES
jgi:tRNA 2-thiocytidine biosynthesis protein TtcA